MPSFIRFGCNYDTISGEKEHPCHYENFAMTTLILYNADVLTLDPAFPRAEMVAIRDDRILAVGRNQDRKAYERKRARVIDCRGRTVLPGFIDVHCHVRALAESYAILNLEPRTGVRSISDIEEKIKQFSLERPSGAWIRGRGYNEFYLGEKRHPNRWDLDRAAPDHPVKLTQRTGVAHVLNSVALRRVGIGKESPDPPEGLIERDHQTGEPTGLLYGMGKYLSERIPSLERQELDRGMKMANEELLSSGITSVQDVSSRNGLKEWKQFKAWKITALLKPRLIMSLGLEAAHSDRESFTSPLDRNQLRVGGVKVILEETTGRLLPEQAELDREVLQIHRFENQLLIHAFEEEAIESACSAIEAALEAHPAGDHRHRIEHCAVCPPPLARRVASLGIMVATQPAFIYYNGERYLRTIPREKLDDLYSAASLLSNGVRVAASSDAPISPASPLMGLYAACSRKGEDGEVISPNQVITPIEALRMYTMESARANFDEKMKGSVSPGKLADLVVLNGDPTRVEVDQIRDLEVDMTLIGGGVAWERAGAW
jgi:predicted amidohydrolase YtcJ